MRKLTLEQQCDQLWEARSQQTAEEIIKTEAQRLENLPIGFVPIYIRFLENQLDRMIKQYVNDPVEEEEIEYMKKRILAGEFVEDKFFDKVQQIEENIIKPCQKNNEPDNEGEEIWWGGNQDRNPANTGYDRCSSCFKPLGWTFDERTLCSDCWDEA